ncbi:hypothetical protein HC028_00895 [Planosporangium flavigriseum]|uniref:Uncharacterized protein n=1 Tax=Planosporangium flavigriseum TaxID=373681 RepID=A0A8J3LMJ3_9ACTN|nr:hypothetical protein [Planosporangium flavigriseum]NJC63080.1 hypothetical protein [Planosporangium flavigriseum]GIG74452.1 hypothetical protein Pfl04_28560 [Planosporangium flavigriseum]
MTLLLHRRRDVETNSITEGRMQVDRPWAVPVGILGTAAERLTRLAGSLPLSDSVDLAVTARTVHVDLHEVFGEVAMVLGFCPQRDQRHVLADAAMSVFAAWLVQVGKAAPSTPGESPHRLVCRWVVNQPLWAVMRELSAAAGVQRLRRLAGELGAERFETLLRAEVATGAHVSGGALALSDCARSAESREGGTRQ